jgi:hypothetical protein
MVQLFWYVQKKPEKESILFSQKFTDVLRFIRRTFYITELHFSIIEPILKISEDFDEQKMIQIINILTASGDILYANDLMLIYEISKSSTLYELITNKPQLIKDVSIIH